MRQAKRENKWTKPARNFLYINGEMYTPTPEPTPKLRRVQGQNPTGTPTIKRQTNPFKRQQQGSSDNTRSLIRVRGGSNRFQSANFIIERLWC